MTSIETLCQPIIQDRLHKLFNDEPPFLPGAPSTQPLPRPASLTIGGTPRRGGFGSLLLKTPAATPRGLRCIGEQVAGTKCGSVGVTGNTALRRLRSVSATENFS